MRTSLRDGGGVVPAARRVVHGRRRIARLYLLLARKLRDRLTEKVMWINGERGLVSFLDGKTTLGNFLYETNNGKIGAVTLYSTRQNSPAFRQSKLNTLSQNRQFFVFYIERTNRACSRNRAQLRRNNYLWERQVR